MIDVNDAVRHEWINPKPIVKTELIRLYLSLQQFTTDDLTSLTEEQDTVLCSLWDTINSGDVAQFYLDNDMMDVLGLILSKSTHARLTELTAGIVANLVYNGAESVERALAENIPVSELIIKTDDSLALYQLFRILRGCCYKFTRAKFDSFYKELSDDFHDKMTFMLENSINHQLLNEIVMFLHDVKTHYEDDGEFIVIQTIYSTGGF